MTRSYLRRPNPETITLTRLLSHLESSLTSPDATVQNRFERRKETANLEYARTLLLKLEHDNTSTKESPRKQALQADLRLKREVIQRLQTKIQDLDTEQRQREEEEEEEEEEEADADAEFENKGAEIDAPAELQTSPRLIQREHQEKEEPPNLADAAQTLSSGLRARKIQTDPVESSNPMAAISTGTSLNANRAALFDRNTNAKEDSIAEREALLTAHRSEQDNLTTSLLSLATALKSSAQSFSSSLENEKTILDRATQGLDKNAAGMDAAGRRMGTLRRMTEGKGLWGRMFLYAYIGGLWLALMVLFFVVPKLRF